MDKLIELLQQIQELAGVGVDALKGASKGQRPEGREPGGKPEEGSPAEERGEPPAEAKAEGDQPQMMRRQ